MIERDGDAKRAAIVAGNIPALESVLRWLEMAHHSRRLNSSKSTSTNGSALRGSGAESATRSLRHVIQQFQSSEVSEIEPLPFVEPLRPIDTDLDEVQTDVVARALSGPDLLLVRGRSGTGKTRTAVELLRQIAARGLRVLVTAKEPAVLDRILASIHAAGSFQAVRVLSSDENPQTAPPEIEAQLASTQERSAYEGIIATLRDHEHNVESRLGTFLELSFLLTRFRESIEQLSGLRSRRASIESRRSSRLDDVQFALAPETAPETEAEIASLKSLHAEHEKSIADWEVRHSQAQAQRSRYEEELGQLRLAHEESQQRTATGIRAWVRRVFQPIQRRELADRLLQIQASLEEQTKRIEQTERAIKTLIDERASIEAAYAEEASRRIEVCDKACLSVIDKQLQRVETELQTLRGKIENVLETLPAQFQRPDLESSASIRKSEDQLARTIEEARELLRQAVCWRESAKSDREAILASWRDSVPVVVAPLHALRDSPWCRPTSERFEYCLILNAQDSTENELLLAEHAASKWVLFGEPPQPAPMRSEFNRNGYRRSKEHRPRAVPDLYARLWDTLHQATWIRRNGRLCCVLRRVPSSEVGSLEVEKVADRSDVELTIWDRKPSEPVLAEISFPESISILAAQEYVFRELGEIPAPWSCRTAQWEAFGGDLRFRVGAKAHLTPHKHSVMLEESVFLCGSRSENVDDATVEFRGWSRSQAEEWIHKHFQFRDSGRTCDLTRDYRHAPVLAEWLDGAIFGLDSVSRDSTAVEFISVPRRMPFRSNHRGGAGIEINLANVEHRLLLPEEMSKSLGSTGWVNLAEARAISELLPRQPRNHRVIVTAPYNAQCQVLRQFCNGSRVETVEAAGGLECDVLVVSLTRSHATRAVTYGDDSAHLPRALQNARCRILFVGDPGTLARRAAWEGAVDHFDEVAAERERRWVRALLPFTTVRTVTAPSRVAQVARV